MTIEPFKFSKKGNIVVAVAPYPMDIDLYQSQKALENGRLALEDGGTIILVSKCRDGVGEDTFLDLLCSAKTCEDVMCKIDQGYKLGYHKAAKMAQIGVNAEMLAENPDSVTLPSEENNSVRAPLAFVAYTVPGFTLLGTT